MLINLCGRDFYESQRAFARRCAIKIVPLVLDLIPCRSVVEVGCGDGTWLKAFKEHGVAEILGIDGDHIEEDTLVFPKETFKPFDLTKPIEFNKKFDLVVSLEVAEHLPPDFSEIFVITLASLGQVIMFSAAIPYQVGVNHLNEQWPDFWAALFREKGFVPIDYIGKKLWRDTTLA
jgi:2-polyprenyl-3-methyl-5-hydroxy-6-metoxy-1,4-benzoquinol methylase